MTTTPFPSQPLAQPSGLEAKLQDVSLGKTVKKVGKHLVDSFKGIFYDPIKSDLTINRDLAEQTVQQIKQEYTHGISLGALASLLAEKDRTLSRKTANHVFTQLYSQGLVHGVTKGLSQKEQKAVLKDAIKQYYQTEGKSVVKETLRRFANHYVRPIGMAALIGGAALHTGGASLAFMAAMDVAEIGAMTYIPKLAKEKGWKDGEYKASATMISGLGLLQIPRLLAGDARALANVGRYGAALTSLVKSKKAQEIFQQEGASRNYYQALDKAETWSAVAAGLLGVSGIGYLAHPGYVSEVQQDWQKSLDKIAQADNHALPLQKAGIGVGNLVDNFFGNHTPKDPNDMVYDPFAKRCNGLVDPMNPVSSKQGVSDPLHTKGAQAGAQQSIHNKNEHLAHLSDEKQSPLPRWRHPSIMGKKEFDPATMYKHNGELFYKEENDLVSNILKAKDGKITVAAKDELLQYAKNHDLVWKLAYDLNNDKKITANEIFTAQFKGKDDVVFKVNNFDPNRKFYLGAFDTDNKQWIASVANKTKAGEMPVGEKKPYVNFPRFPIKPPHVGPFQPKFIFDSKPLEGVDQHPLTGNYWYELKHKYPGAAYLDEMVKQDYGCSVGSSADAAGDGFANLLKDLTVGHDMKTNVPGYVAKHGATGLAEGAIGHLAQRVGNIVTFGAISDPDGYKYNGNPLKWLWNIPRTAVSYAWNDLAKPVTHVVADAAHTVTNTLEVPLKTVLGVVPEGRVMVDAAGNIVQGTTTALTDYLPGGDALDHRIDWWKGKIVDGKFPHSGEDFNLANATKYHKVKDPAAWRGAVNPFYTNTPTRNVMEHLGPAAMGGLLYKGIGALGAKPGPLNYITGGDLIHGGK